MKNNISISILGTGNLGQSIANGLLHSGQYNPAKVTLTRRRVERISDLKDKGFIIQKDNRRAVRNSDVIILAVEPQQVNHLLDEIKEDVIPDKHIIISVITGVTIKQILKRLDKEVIIVRAMPNTAIAIQESMTCLSSNNSNTDALKIAREIFNTVGKTLIIDEENMTAATALGACGIAFFLRAIRAASQGGIEIGFHSDKAMQIAAQTAKGAAALLLQNGQHPEYEIDKVTTPRGVTISGLNQMEHEGFSSAMIKGIVTSWTKASKLYTENGE